MTKEELNSAWYEMNILQSSTHPLVTHEIRERAKHAWATIQNIFINEQNELTIETRRLIALLEKVEQALKDVA